ATFVREAKLKRLERALLELDQPFADELVDRGLRLRLDVVWVPRHLAAARGEKGDRLDLEHVQRDRAKVRLVYFCVRHRASTASRMRSASSRFWHSQRVFPSVTMNTSRPVCASVTSTMRKRRATSALLPLVLAGTGAVAPALTSVMTARPRLEAAC